MYDNVRSNMFDGSPYIRMTTILQEVLKMTIFYNEFEKYDFKNFCYICQGSMR